MKLWMLLAALGLATVYLLATERDDWPTERALYNCKLVEQQRTPSVPKQTWHCDGGKVVTRYEQASLVDK